MDRSKMVSSVILMFLLGVTACAPVPQPTAPPASATDSLPATAASEQTATSAPSATSTKAIPVTGSLMRPEDVVPAPGKLVYDVESTRTSAPYGDSFKINRFERPFLKDMTYVPDVDILSFSIGEDADWYYVSMEVKGKDPNNFIGIRYGVEIDLTADGFGDYLIWAQGPYTTEWETSTVRVFEDSNHDSAGRSSSQSDGDAAGNGYETRVFDGEADDNAEPDLAWVRMQEGQPAAVQFAFKKSWIGPSFLAGVLSDAGLKDVSRLDYSDHFTEAEAGSPVRNSPHFPVGALYAVDNTCWQAYNMETIVYQPKFCPPETLPTATRRPPLGESGTLVPATDAPPTVAPPPAACEPTFDPLDCGDVGYNPSICQCNSPTEPPVATDPPIATDPPVATDPPIATDPPVTTEP